MRPQKQAEAWAGWGRLCGWLAAAVVAGAALAAAAEPEAVEAPPAGEEEGPELELTLEAAMERALEYNRELARGALEVAGRRLAQQQAREEVRGLRLIPEGGGETGSAGDLWQAGVRAETTLPSGAKLSAAPRLRLVDWPGADGLRRGELCVEITQPLFRQFGALMTEEPVVAAAEALRAARRRWERERSALLVRVAENYEEILALQARMALDEAFAARLEKLWRLAEAQETRGRTTRAEVLRMNLQRGEAALRLEASRNRHAIRLEEFADLLGLPAGITLRLAPPPVLTLEIPSPEQALETALSQRPDYAEVLREIATARRKVQQARRQLQPDVQLLARHSLFGEGGQWSDAARWDQDEWVVGLAAAMDWNRRGARLAAEQAAVDAEGRELAAEIARRRLALEVNAGLTDYRRARAEWEQSERNRALAVRRAELARALFEAGRAPADSVSDAEADRLQAEFGEVESRAAAAVAAYRLLHVLGTLAPVPADLRPAAEEKE